MNWFELPESERIHIGLGLCALTATWCMLAWWRWAMWGDLTVDCGREMFVPWALTQGKVLYRDVWYPYGPLAPYVNATLFRIFGPSLTVLYSAGLLALLAQAFALYLAGVALSFPLAGLAVGGAVLIESLETFIFNYPLPYSYASVYGSVFSSLVLLLAIRSAQRERTAELLGAGVFAGLAFITKLEFGFACYGALGVLVMGRALRQRSWRHLGRDLLLLLPGIVICFATIAWMVSLRGVEFITQENISSWPTNYFMRVYGKRWLSGTGAIPLPGVLAKAWVKGLLCLAVWVALRAMLSAWLVPPTRELKRARWCAVAVALAVAIGITLATTPGEWLRPRLSHLVSSAMLLLVATATLLLAYAFWRSRYSPRFLALLIAFLFPVLLAFRVALSMQVAYYPIYYNGPVFLAFLILLLALSLPTEAEKSRLFRAFVAGIVLVGFCAAMVKAVRPMYRAQIPMARYETDRGLIYAPASKVSAHRDAVRFIKQAAARGDKVLSVPEDTSLYFFAHVLNPTRSYDLVPGTVSPGHMTEEVLNQMESAPVKYVIWSNRQTPEYGDARFGVDYNQTIGDYIRSHFRPIAHLGPGEKGRELTDPVRPYDRGIWYATIWERLSEARPQ